VSHDRRAATVGNGGACLAFAGAQNRYDDVIDDFPGLTSAIALVGPW